MDTCCWHIVTFTVSLCPERGSGAAFQADNKNFLNNCMGDRFGAQ